MASVDGYPSNVTIESMLQAGRFGNGHLANHWKRVGAACLDGVPLLTHPYYLRTPSPNERRLSKRWSEVLAVARVFAFYEETANLTLSDPPLPDIQASTQHDGMVAIEVTEITDTRPLSAIADQLDTALEDAIAAHGTTLRHRYWISYKRDTPPPSTDLPKVVGELLQAINSGQEFRFYKAEAGKYPVLVRFGISITTGDGSSVEISDGSGGYAPSTLVPTAQGNLDEKRKKAKSYDIAIPLWLVMNITDRFGIWYEAIQLLVKSKPAIDPFERAFIMYRDALVTLSDSGGYTKMLLKSDRRRI